MVIKSCVSNLHMVEKVTIFQNVWFLITKLDYKPFWNEITTICPNSHEKVRFFEESHLLLQGLKWLSIIYLLYGQKVLCEYKVTFAYSAHVFHVWYFLEPTQMAIYYLFVIWAKSVMWVQSDFCI